MSATPLTPAQASAMATLGNYVGQTVSVQTSRYTHSGKGAALYPPTWKPVDTINAAVLRGLQSRGLNEIKESFWRGANVLVKAQGVTQ